MRTSETAVLRPAHPSEAKAMASLSRLHVEHGLRWRWTPRRIRASIDDPETIVLVATVEGVLAGFAVMRFGDLIAHLHLLAVTPKSRRQGIGRALLKWLETSCRTAGVRRIRLELRESNDAALAFYQRLGYRRVGHIAGYYDRRESALVLWKTLT